MRSSKILKPRSRTKHPKKRSCTEPAARRIVSHSTRALHHNRNSSTLKTAHAPHSQHKIQNQSKVYYSGNTRPPLSSLLTPQQSHIPPSQHVPFIEPSVRAMAIAKQQPFHNPFGLDFRPPQLLTSPQQLYTASALLNPVKFLPHSKQDTQRHYMPKGSDEYHEDDLFANTDASAPIGTIFHETSLSHHNPDESIAKQKGMMLVDHGVDSEHESDLYYPDESSPDSTPPRGSPLLTTHNQSSPGSTQRSASGEDIDEVLRIKKKPPTPPPIEPPKPKYILNKDGWECDPITMRPLEPEPEMCCGNDCPNCVWIQHDEQLFYWKRDQAAKKKAEAPAQDAAAAV